MVNEIALTEKYENGFATVTANCRVSTWRVALIATEAIQKPKSIAYGKKIIVRLLSNLNEYKGSIEWLTQLLQSELKANELNAIYSDVITNFEQKDHPRNKKGD